MYRPIYSRYKLTSGNLTFNANEQRALENMNISVGILFLGAVDLDICRVYIKTASGHEVSAFSSNGWGQVHCVIRQKRLLSLRTYSQKRITVL